MNDTLVINTASKEKIKIKYDPYELVGEDNPILYTPTPEFIFDGSVDLKELEGRLIETVKTHRALGLAAPQVGLSYRVFVMGAENHYFSVFNPVITSYSEETVHMPEYCLSFAFLELNISRPKVIQVSFQDAEGKRKELTLSGISARIFLHEISHLNGVTFDMEAKPLALKNGLKKREKQIKNFARELVQQNYYGKE